MQILFACNIKEHLLNSYFMINYMYISGGQWDLYDSAFKNK